MVSLVTRNFSSGFSCVMKGSFMSPDAGAQAGGLHRRSWDAAFFGAICLYVSDLVAFELAERVGLKPRHREGSQADIARLREQMGAVCSSGTI